MARPFDRPSSHPSCPPLLALLLLSSLAAFSGALRGSASSSTRTHETCIIGAGPAGLQLGFFLSQAKRDYVILERERSAGAFFKTYPRHRQLISINKRFTGHRSAFSCHFAHVSPLLLPPPTFPDFLG